MSEQRWPVPSSWRWSSAGDIARIVGGGTPSSKIDGNFAEKGIPWITPADLTGYSESHISRGRRDLSKQGFAGSGAQLIPAGSVLFSSRAPIGYCVIAVNEVSTNQGFKSFVLDGDINPGYVRHYLLSAKEYAESKASGTTFMELSGARVAELAIPIAPLPEQRRIVAKVDGLTARTARARKELDRIPTLIARYKQRLLVLAFSGELTAGWRKDNTVSAETHVLHGLTNELDGLEFSKSWTSSSLAELAENHDGKRRPIKAADRALRHGEYRYYGASGVIDSIDDYLFDGDYLLIGEDGANLISRSTPIAFLASGQFWVNNHAHILRAKPVTSNEFLCWFINMINLVPYVTGSAQPKLTQANLNKIRAPLPPLEEQAEIVRLIESAFGWLDRLAADHTTAARLLPKLDAAILTKAFRGELVPQDPNDEPASVLLERIKSERKAKPKKAHGRKVQEFLPDTADSKREIYPTTFELAKPRKPRGSAMSKSRHDDDVKDKPYLAGLLKSARNGDVQALFRAADLPVADFYKQLAWEIDKGHIVDNPEALKAA